MIDDNGNISTDGNTRVPSEGKAVDMSVVVATCLGVGGAFVEYSIVDLADKVLAAVGY